MLTTTLSRPETLPPSQSFDIIIIGAGILGCAAAHALGEQGRSVLLIERDWNEPDRIVGELLQPGGVDALQILGLRDTLECMDAVPVHGYAVFQSKEHVQLTYPTLDRSDRPCGYSFHHGRFVMNLRSAALAHENVTGLEATVNELIVKDDIVQGVTCSFKDGPRGVSMSAPLTIIADGCFSKFRKHIDTKPIVCKSNFVGLVLKDVRLPYPNHGHVFLADPSPILLYQIGTHDTRILVDIPGPLPSIGNGSLKKYMMEFVGPQLPRSIQGPFYKALEEDRLRSMPNSWLPPLMNTKLGVVALGDAMNMRHPLTGGGMTVALWDVIHFTQGLGPLASLKNPNAVRKIAKRFFWIRKPSSSVINILANALYALFSAGDDENLLWLQRACFGYFKLGGRCASTPVGLLAGLIQAPWILIGHFFAVAAYGMFLILGSAPLYRFPFSLWRACRVLWTACLVIVPLILAELIG